MQSGFRAVAIYMQTCGVHCIMGICWGQCHTCVIRTRQWRTDETEVVPAAGGEVKKSPRYFLSGRRRRRRQTLDSGRFSERFARAKPQEAARNEGVTLKLEMICLFFPLLLPRSMKETG